MLDRPKGFSRTTRLQHLVVQAAKCSIFEGNLEDWDRRSMELHEYRQVLQGTVGLENTTILAYLLKMDTAPDTKASWAARKGREAP